MFEENYYAFLTLVTHSYNDYLFFFMFYFNFSLEYITHNLLFQIFPSKCVNVDRLKKQELLLCAQSAEDILRTVDESAKRDLSTSLQSCSDSVAEPPSKTKFERPKILISIQDKDGLKHFRVYMVYIYIYISLQKVCLN